jgi:hypothetical protein
MPTIDEDISQIERDIRTLKIEYEQYFGGGRKRPPTDTQWRVDTLVRKCNEHIGELSFGQRFRLNNLTQTYAKYQDMWRKKTMQKEGSVTQRHFGATAKAIEAARAARAAAEPSAAPAPSVKEAREAAASARSFAMSFSDPANEKEKLQELYRKLIDARTQTGEKAGAPSLQDFERFVQKKTRDLQKKSKAEIEYTVSIEAGRVKLKARATN